MFIPTCGEMPGFAIWQSKLALICCLSRDFEGDNIEKGPARMCFPLIEKPWKPKVCCHVYASTRLRSTTICLILWPLHAVVTPRKKKQEWPVSSNPQQAARCTVNTSSRARPAS